MSLFISRLLSCTIILSCFSSIAQKKNHPKVLSIKKDKSLNNYEKTAKTRALLIDSDFLINIENISDVYHQIGTYLYYNKDYNQAILELQKAIDIRETTPELNYKLDNSLYNIAQQYRFINNIEQHEYFLNKIIKNGNHNRYTYKAYNKLGELFIINGDYFRALQYFEIVINSFPSYNDQKILILAYKYAITAYSYINNLSNDDLIKVELYSQKLESIDQSINIGLNNNLAKIYKGIGHKEKAIEYLKKILPIALKRKRYNDAGTISHNIAVLYSESKNNALANKYYKKALGITNNIITIADTHYNQGFYLQTKTSIDKNAYYDKALNIALKLKDTIKPLDYLPSIDDIKASQYKIDILGYLINKANNFVIAYNEEHKRIYLEHSKSTLYLIDQLVSLIRFESSSNDSKLFWINKGVDSYMLAVKVCYLLNDTAAAFYFMEKNKSLLLLENLNATHEKERLKIPDSILKREFNLRYAILSIENKRHKTSNNNIQTKLYLEKENTYAHFLDSIRTLYPTYFNSKKEPEILSLEELRKRHVSKTTNYIEYILNDELGYGFFCSEGQSILFEIKNIPELLNAIDTLKTLLNHPIIYSKDNKLYNETAFSIYKKVFPFRNSLQLISNKKLVVVPDYKLKSLPFEALITKPNNTDFIQGYLIKQNIEVSYYQSASVFKQIEKQNRSAKKQLIAFAPIVFNYDSLPSLQRSKTEMDHISSLLPTTLLKNEKATTTAFISSLNDYDIVHINTHAGINDDNEPWLAFSDKKIHLKELYGINNQANLVILDACKSASGKLLKGEGVMSLSRGFFYSGSKSVIASLWNVNEKSNNKILISFYNGIKQGQTKSKALHNAKLKYLSNHQNSELSPYFWSSLILTGDTKAIDFNKTSNLYLILIGVIFLILILFLKKLKVY
ncbi:MAG: hypothetical protein COA88_06335 [Kordia sp.]|nr:MAG: hypothetical protein COA88_06335 [Kordia sp.]